MNDDDIMVGPSNDCDDEDDVITIEEGDEENPNQLIIEYLEPVVTPPRSSKDPTHRPSYFLSSPEYLQLIRQYYENI